MNSLIGLFTSTLIITGIPDSSKGKLIRLLKNIFLSDHSKGQVAQNAIYREFLMKLKTLVENNKLTLSELEILSFNLQYIEGESITGLIPYPRNSTKFISNSYIVQLIQDKLKHHNITTSSTIKAIPFNTVIEHGNTLLEHLGG